MKPEDMEFVWRCDHCGSATVLSGCGGQLTCVCERQPHTDFHFQVLTPGGAFEMEVWYDPKDLYD